jgi:hypothetical protein
MDTEIKSKNCDVAGSSKSRRGKRRRNTGIQNDENNASTHANVINHTSEEDPSTCGGKIETNNQTSENDPSTRAEKFNPRSRQVNTKNCAGKINPRMPHDDNSAIPNDESNVKVNEDERNKVSGDHLSSRASKNNQSRHDDNPIIRCNDINLSSDDNNELSTRDDETTASARDDGKMCPPDGTTKVVPGETQGVPTDGNAEEKVPVLTGGTKQVLHEIAREKREWKATKADDAAVPEYLWEEHLLNDCPTPLEREDTITTSNMSLANTNASMVEAASHHIILGMDEDGTRWTPERQMSFGGRRRLCKWYIPMDQGS